MTTKRVYEIAKEQGVSNREVIDALDRNGVQVEAASNEVDHAVAVAALRSNGAEGASNGASPGGNGAGDGAPRRLLDRIFHPSAGAMTNGRDPNGAASGPSGSRGWAPLERARLRLRLLRVRRRRRRAVEDLGHLVFEMNRLDGRRRDLVDSRLDRLAADDEEQRALEDRLGDRRPGTTCPECGLYSREATVCLSCGAPLPADARPAGADRPLSVPALVAAVVLMASGYLLGGLDWFVGSNDGERERAVAQRAATRSAAPPGGVAGSGYRSLIAHATGTGVAVFKTVHSKKAMKYLRSPNLDGAPLVFLVKTLGATRALVYLPSRPNGSIGWVRRARIRLSGHNYSAEVNLDAHRLTVWNGTKPFVRERVGIGRSVTPTPSGLYYITSLLKQPDRKGLYGPYAFGLSAHSDVVFEFAGRDGILGIHGTNAPKGIGKDVSKGCIRVSNRAITRLAKILPPGTPVRIVRSKGKGTRKRSAAPKRIPRA